MVRTSLTPRTTSDSWPHQNAFARHLRAEGRAYRAVQLHTQAPRIFAALLVDNGQEPEVDHLTQDNLVGWFNHLRGRRQEPGTIRIRRAGMRRFIGWLTAEVSSTPTRWQRSASLIRRRNRSP
ncbi:hypothetical protein [Amycolatopsis sp.]|uniref:hypothetical protein n=1 Tax=Amycolatopsis sp. TaxID=37632 RepID=UPI002C57AE0D|nr:hypothetical protein [Amycolatopsis sp.]HVV10013.1 hypothetical protein [Amycolatopsis sp.]